MTVGGGPRVLRSPSRRLDRKRPGWSHFRRLLVTIVGLGLIGGGASVVREHRAVERDAQAARDDLAAGRAARARDPLGRWLRARPRSAEAHAVLAEVALADGDFGEVKRAFNEARALGYPEERLERLRAIWLARLGRYAEAEPILTGIWESRPKTDPAVDEALARIFLKTYRLRGAQAVLERWIADAPSDGRPFLWLTEIDRRTEVDNPQSWERHYREALRRDPELDPARLGLAESLRKMHRNEEAAREFAHYLARHPDDPAALAGAGLNALALGDLAEAARLLDATLARAPTDPAALKGRAEVDLHRGELTAAAHRLDQAIQADPFSDEAVHVRAQVRMMLGDPAGARADRLAFDRLKQDQAELLQMRSRLLDHPEDSDTRSKVVAWMFAHGRDQDGLEWAMAILAHDPNHAPTCRLLADYYARRPDGAGLANFYRAQAAARTSTP
jgi:tetratricopeptide (TPR) repeat protein